jgi:hypothetical protein
VRLFGEELQIERLSGRILSLEPDDYTTPMCVYDYLCASRGDRRLSGEWKSTSALGNHVHSGGTDGGLYSDSARFFATCSEALSEACRGLGGIPQKKGDVSFILQTFDEFPVWVRLWLGDEEFEPALSLLWDANALQYMHYETVWYLSSALITRLRRDCLR